MTDKKQNTEIKPILSSLFNWASRLAMLAWALLVIHPFWHGATLVVSIIITLLCALYVYLVFLGKRHDLAGASSGGSFSSLHGVMKLFKNPRGTLAGWVHYLAFDLFVGLFIVLDAQQQNISHWYLMPILLATLMLGPSGLLIYVLLRFLIVGNYLAFDFAL
jgi:hypothetical protein